MNIPSDLALQIAAQMEENKITLHNVQMTDEGDSRLVHFAFKTDNDIDIGVILAVENTKGRKIQSQGLLLAVLSLGSLSNPLV
jgi:hypothetical protein